MREGKQTKLEHTLHARYITSTGPAPPTHPIQTHTTHTPKSHLRLRRRRRHRLDGLRGDGPSVRSQHTPRANGVVVVVVLAVIGRAGARGPRHRPGRPAGQLGGEVVVRRPLRPLTLPVSLFDWVGFMCCCFRRGKRRRKERMRKNDGFGFSLCAIRLGTHTFCEQRKSRHVLTYSPHNERGWKKDTIKQVRTNTRRVFCPPRLTGVFASARWLSRSMTGRNTHLQKPRMAHRHPQVPIRRTRMKRMNIPMALADASLAGGFTSSTTSWLFVVVDISPSPTLNSNGENTTCSNTSKGVG